MSDYIKREDMRAILSQSKTVSQAWDGLFMLPSADVVPRDFHNRICEEMAKRHTEHLRLIGEQINNMPKHGEWKWISSTYDRTPCRKTYMCSCCRHEVITFDVEPWEHYCPQCGAKMDGEREGE